LVAEGDLVAGPWRATGTHQGELMGIPATGKPISISGMGMDRVVDGKIVESWGNWDAMGMMAQLGVIPAAAGTPA
jgi:predicted ester cyclase